MLAGAHVTHGSSREEERFLLTAAIRSLRAAFSMPGQLMKQARRGFMHHAVAVLFPSLYEGFGLIPYEAARADVPCLFAPQTALGRSADRARDAGSMGR